MVNVIFRINPFFREFLREAGLRWWSRQSPFNPTNSLCRSAAASSSLHQSEEPVYWGHTHAAGLGSGPGYRLGLVSSWAVQYRHFWKNSGFGLDRSPMGLSLVWVQTWFSPGPWLGSGLILGQFWLRPELSQVLFHTVGLDLDLKQSWVRSP